MPLFTFTPTASSQRSLLGDDMGGSALVAQPRIVKVGGDDVGGGGFGSGLGKGLGQGVGIGIGLLAFGAGYALLSGKRIG